MGDDLTTRLRYDADRYAIGNRYLLMKEAADRLDVLEAENRELREAAASRCSACDGRGVQVALGTVLACGSCRGSGKARAAAREQGDTGGEPRITGGCSLCNFAGLVRSSVGAGEIKPCPNCTPRLDAVPAPSAPVLPEPDRLDELRSAWKLLAKVYPMLCDGWPAAAAEVSAWLDTNAEPCATCGRVQKYHGADHPFTRAASSPGVEVEPQAAPSASDVPVPTPADEEDAS